MPKKPTCVCGSCKTCKQRARQLVSRERRELLCKLLRIPVDFKADMTSLHRQLAALPANERSRNVYVTHPQKTCDALDIIY